jgi:hypothetical protein
MLDESQFSCADNYINQSTILYFMLHPYLLKRGKVRRTGSDGALEGGWPAIRAVAATLQLASESQDKQQCFNCVKECNQRCCHYLPASPASRIRDVREQRFISLAISVESLANV